MNGQSHGEGRALSGLAFGDNGAVVAVGNAAADRQADAGALLPESGVKTGFESYLASMFAGFVVTFESLTLTSLSVRLKSGCDVRLQALESPLMTRV